MGFFAIGLVALAAAGASYLICGRRVPSTADDTLFVAFWVGVVGGPIFLVLGTLSAAELL